MTCKGIVSTINNDNRKARVIFRDRDNVITPELPVAIHVGDLQVNDVVAVVFFSSGLSDGLIIAKF